MTLQRLHSTIALSRKDHFSHDEDDYLVEEFRQLPDEWKEEAVRQVAMFRHLAKIPSARFIGEEPDQ